MNSGTTAAAGDARLERQEAQAERVMRMYPHMPACIARWGVMNSPVSEETRLLWRYAEPSVIENYAPDGPGIDGIDSAESELFYALRDGCPGLVPYVRQKWADCKALKELDGVIAQIVKEYEPESVWYSYPWNNPGFLAEEAV